MPKDISDSFSKIDKKKGTLNIDDMAEIKKMKKSPYDQMRVCFMFSKRTFKMFKLIVTEKNSTIYHELGQLVEDYVEKNTEIFKDLKI